MFGCPKAALLARPVQNAVVSAGVRASRRRIGPVGSKGNCPAGWGELYHGVGAGEILAAA